jgi:Ni/Co efflux regulator RcnB
MDRHLTALLAVAMLGASHAWAQAPQPTVLTNAQLKALLSNGLSVRITGADRPNTAARTGSAVYQKDGTARFNEAAATTTHTGSWRIEDNKFCTKYQRLGSGCFNVQKTGETTYKLIPLDGLLEGTWDVVKK